MDTQILLLCCGTEPTWDGETPRHLVPIAGEPLIERTERICREVGHPLTLVCDKPYLRDSIRNWFDPGRNRWVYDTIQATRPLWRDRTILLIGDVVYYQELLEQILASDRTGTWIGAFGVLALVFVREPWELVERALSKARQEAERRQSDELQILQPFLGHVYRATRRDAFDLDYQSHYDCLCREWPWVAGDDPEASGPVLVLLAAGDGGRLACQKALLEFGGRTLLARAVDAFAAEGVRKAVVVVGYEVGRVRASLGDRRGRVRIRYVENPDWATTKTADSLLCARDHWDGQPFFCLSADHVFDPAFAASLSIGGHGMAEMMTVYDPNTPALDGEETVAVPGGTLWAGGQWCRLAWPAEPGSLGEAPELFSFTAKLSRELADYLPGRDLFEVANAVGGQLQPLPRGVRWMEIDTPEDLARAREVFGA